MKSFKVDIYPVSTRISEVRLKELNAYISTHSTSAAEVIKTALYDFLDRDIIRAGPANLVLNGDEKKQLKNLKPKGKKQNVNKG